MFKSFLNKFTSCDLIKYTKLQNEHNPIQFFISHHSMNARGTSHQRLRHCAFSHSEDADLCSLVEKYGTDAWFTIAQQMVRRSARQCKERWQVLTVRELSRRPWTDEEDQLLVQKCFELGPKWKVLETFFVDRTSQSIKNRWNILTQRAERDSLKSVERPPVMPELKPSAPQAHPEADKWDWMSYDLAAVEPLDIFGASDDQIWEMITLPQGGIWQ